MSGDPKTKYFCDPEKNVICRSRYQDGWCGSICKLTFHEEYAKRNPTSEASEGDFKNQKSM